jgi:hypothetical protein
MKVWVGLNWLSTVSSGELLYVMRAEGWGDFLISCEYIDTHEGLSV